MSPLPIITSTESLNTMVLGLSAVSTLVATIASTQEKKAGNRLAAERLQFEAAQQRIAEGRLKLEAEKVELEAEQTRFKSSLELNKALHKGEISTEMYVALNTHKAVNVRAVVAENNPNQPSTLGSETQGKVVSVDKDLSLSVDKENLEKNAKSWVSYAAINSQDPKDEEFSLMTSMGKHRIVPKNQYLIGVDNIKAKQAQDTPPEEVMKVYKPRFYPKGKLPFASASMAASRFNLPTLSKVRFHYDHELKTQSPVMLENDFVYENARWRAIDYLPLVFSVVILVLATFKYCMHKFKPSAQ